MEPRHNNRNHDFEGRSLGKLSFLFFVILHRWSFEQT